MALPRVAITAGDPAGIGPEIAAKAAADPRVLARCVPIVYGADDHAEVEIGRASAYSGRVAYDTLLRAVADARSGQVDAIATAPISKLAFSLAGLAWKGHTDLLADLCGSRRVVMLFHAQALKVALITVHIPLAQVPAALTPEVVAGTIDLVAASLPAFGIAQPRLGLAGLNPHAGEAGVLGREDDEVLAPAVQAARGRGIAITGPWPADTIFVRAARGEFDAVLACYHDQGLIPVKLLAFGKAVNVTLGLPIIRTSVDHGTAYDIAGRGVADAGSMVEAVLLAAQLADATRAHCGQAAVAAVS